MEEFLKSRKISKVYHFTRAGNLASIIEHGLLPIENLKTLGMPVESNDPFRFDGQKNAICMSIGFPNYKMFYSLRCQSPKIDWVVLEMTSRVLLECDCAFCCTNAASSSVTCIDIAARKGLEALRKMFEEIPRKPLRSELDLYDYYTTDPQAEVLVYSGVATSYIDSVNFNNYIVKENYATIINSRIPSKVNRDLFSYRKDWSIWK